MPPTEEDLAWFRSTFRPIPKPQLPDDTVEYSLYIFSSTWQSEDALRNRLREVQKAAAQIQKEYLKEYIWQRQAFGLEIAREDGEVCMLCKERAITNMLTGVSAYRTEPSPRKD